MYELIKIQVKENQQLVSAKELYHFLGYDKTQWARWSKQNIIEDTFFIENEDYITLDMMSKGNKTTDFLLTINMAKELSMLARNEKGKQARRYFIECEKKVLEDKVKKLKNKKIVETRIVPQEFKCRMMSVTEFLEYKEADPRIFNPQSIARQASETCKKDWIDIGKIIRGNTAINLYPLIVLNRIYYDIAEKYLRVANLNLYGFNIDEKTK